MTEFEILCKEKDITILFIQKLSCTNKQNRFYTCSLSPSFITLTFAILLSAMLHDDTNRRLKQRKNKEKKKRTMLCISCRCECFECHILEALASIKHASPCGLKGSLVDTKFSEFFAQVSMVELQFSIKEQLVV